MINVRSFILVKAILVVFLLFLPDVAVGQAVLTDPAPMPGDTVLRAVQDDPAPGASPALPEVSSDSSPGSSPGSSSKDPVEITADGSLEWLRAEQKFIARKNAVAVQGLSSVAAQTLTADYREGAKGEDGSGGGIEISKIRAETDVVLRSNESEAFGDVATYDLDAGLAVMTGDDLRMVSPDQTVTARDKFEYWVEDGRLNAIGDAVVIRPNPKGGQDRLTADTVSAVFEENAAGERVLKTLEAKQNVVITTKEEIVTGAYGIYRASTNKADLTGGVTITRGPNVLRGERAEVDLNTNVSKIFAGSEQQGRPGSGRVSGKFYPSSKNEP